MALFRSSLLQYCILAVVLIGALFESTVNAQDAPTLECLETQIVITLPSSMVTGMEGSDFVFANEADKSNAACQGAADGSNNIVLTTNITECGTITDMGNDTIVYMNGVENLYGDSDVITRDKLFNISLSCTYNRTARVGPLGEGEGSFQLTDWRIDQQLDEEGSYDFDLGFYTDGNYDYEIVGFPVEVELNTDLYMAASVNSPDGTLDVNVESCRATPTDNYLHTDFHHIVENGCPDELETSMVDLPDGPRVGIQTKAFRFIDHGDLVYMHCVLKVCSVGASECEVCTTYTSSGSRRRRDAMNEPNTKLVTRGPLRVVRSADSRESNSAVERIESEEQQSAVTVFNPLMVVVISLATVVIVLVGLMGVIFRKISKIARSSRREYLKEEKIPVLS